VQLGELAEALGLDFEGDPKLELSGLANLDDATPADLSFVTGEGYRRAFAASKAGACLVPPDFDVTDRACLRSALPYRDFARAVDLYQPSRRPAPGVHSTAVIAGDAELGDEVSIGPYAVVGAGTRIGDRSVIHAHVTIYPDVVIGVDCEIHSGVHLRAGVVLGDRVGIQSGAVIGSAGFGFVFDRDGKRVRVPHCCPVEIGDDSHVGANTTIDASHPAHPRHGHAETRTRIGKNVIIDNLVQVGHGACLEDGVTLCAQVGLSGSTVVERGV
jgi:UDP-3-O-[3-hydroxymyristoyl] glucosamine N-acyltransferase